MGVRAWLAGGVRRGKTRRERDPQAIARGLVLWFGHGGGRERDESENEGQCDYIFVSVVVLAGGCDRRSCGLGQGKTNHEHPPSSGD
jgi:hypothetical protein